jgi:uracil-DNA glycosylase
MAWTERQHALLQAMGLRLWSPAAPAQTAGQAPALVAEPRTAHVAGPPAAEPAVPPAPAPAALPRPPAPPTVVTSARPAVGAVATLDWPALREAVAGCRACDLCDSRRQTVFGVGHPRAHWMVVGEAPGEQEDRSGEPFVGAAGQLLDRMLASLGLTREAEGAEPARQVFITNTLKCRPPDNRNPTAEELARCEPFLQRQIALVQPRIILAMGRFAVQALLRSDEAIGRLRGRVHRYQGVPLIVTYHPAYLLRHLPHKARAWEDLCLAAATAERAAADAPR